MKLKKKIKILVYDLFRNQLKKDLTNHLGTVVETSDKLICYVNKNKFKKFQNKFYCYGINKSNLELANMYNLNKPICYLFDNINMDNKMLVIHGYNNVEVMITNSDLKNAYTDIYTDGKLTILSSTLMGDELFSLEAQDLEIKESIIDNRYSKDAFYSLGAKNNMIINDSVLGNKKINLAIVTPSLEMNNDTIEANNLNIVDVKNLISDEDTTIKAQEKININALSLEQINVEAPKIVINGKEYNQRFVRKNPTNEIEQKRIELLDLLSKIKDKYITKYDEILKKKKDTLYNMSLVRKR